MANDIPDADELIATVDPTTGPHHSPTFWAHKPRWCQPWTILVTGASLVILSWLWPQRLWVTIPLAACVLLWWTLFLVLVPRAWQAAMQAGESEDEENLEG